MRLAILLAHGYTSEKNTGTKPTMFASQKRPKIDRRYPGAETFRYAVAMRT
jgi:hypothetical protein